MLLQAQSSVHWTDAEILAHCVGATDKDLVDIARRFTDSIAKRSDDHVCCVCGVVGLNGKTNTMNITELKAYKCPCDEYDRSRYAEIQVRGIVV